MAAIIPFPGTDEHRRSLIVKQLDELIAEIPEHQLLLIARNSLSIALRRAGQTEFADANFSAITTALLCLHRVFEEVDRPEEALA